MRVKRENRIRYNFRDRYGSHENFLHRVNELFEIARKTGNLGINTTCVSRSFGETSRFWDQLIKDYRAEYPEGQLGFLYIDRWVLSFSKKCVSPIYVISSYPKEDTPKPNAKDSQYLETISSFEEEFKRKSCVLRYKGIWERVPNSVFALGSIIQDEKSIKNISKGLCTGSSRSKGSNLQSGVC